MKILLVHNRYQQRGGEDTVYEAERALLAQHGHEVVCCEFSNDEIKGYSALQRLGLAGRTTWSAKSYRTLARLVQREAPDVIHFHNTLPLVSPSGYYAARRSGCAVVQTLHNYRLTCLNGLLLRDGRPCEDCVGKALSWPGVRHACYRDSYAASASVAAMLTTHRTLGTYHHAVDRYITLTHFARRKFVDAGLPPEKIVVKPNFLQEDPGRGPCDGAYALFVGRLAQEKGVAVMLEAWKRLGPRMTLKIVGDGPLAPPLAAPAGPTSAVEWLGRRPRENVLTLMQGAAVLVFPSVCYEGLPMTIVEAYACGLPVIASRRGSMAEIIDDGVTGLHFAANDPADLAARVRWWQAHPEAHETMRQAARAAYEQRYTAEQNHWQLITIYEAARRTRRSAVLTHRKGYRPF